LPIASHIPLPIAITMGDACGIGPEIVLKALAAISAEQAAIEEAAAKKAATEAEAAAGHHAIDAILAERFKI
jgi:4-hydroxy-L-threonine phosphate dehydrogenase PdxA